MAAVPDHSNQNSDSHIPLEACALILNQQTASENKNGLLVRQASFHSGHIA
jgi:hypothetical protein